MFSTTISTTIHYGIDFLQKYGDPTFHFGNPCYKEAPKNWRPKAPAPIDNNTKSLPKYAVQIKTKACSPMDDNTKLLLKYAARIKKYEFPISGVSEKLQHFFFCLWNAIKAIFNRSDWQIAKQKFISVKNTEEIIRQLRNEPSTEKDGNIAIALAALERPKTFWQ